MRAFLPFGQQEKGNSRQIVLRLFHRITSGGSVAVGNGTDQLLPNIPNAWQDRAVHRLAGNPISKEHQRIRVSCISPCSLECPAPNGAGVQQENAAAPRPRRQILKGEIGRFDHWYQDGRTFAIEGGNPFFLTNLRLSVGKKGEDDNKY